MVLLTESDARISALLLAPARKHTGLSSRIPGLTNSGANNLAALASAAVCYCITMHAPYSSKDTYNLSTVSHSNCSLTRAAEPYRYLVHHRVVDDDQQLQGTTNKIEPVSPTAARSSRALGGLLITQQQRPVGTRTSVRRRRLCDVCSSRLTATMTSRTQPLCTIISLVRARKPAQINIPREHILRWVP